MSDALESVFGNIENAKALGGFTSRLGIGSHTLLMKRFNVKESAKGKGKIVESDYLVLETTGGQPNETKGWAWFIGAPGWAGSYEESRLKSFLEVVAKSIGDTSPVAKIGAGLAGPAQLGRGMMFKCIVSAQTNRDGSPKQSPKGETYTEIEWVPVPQSLEDIQRGRAHLDQTAPAVAVAPAVQQQAQPATLPAQSPAIASNNMSSLLASLKR